MSYLTSPRTWTTVAVGAWVLVWAWLGSSFVFAHNFDMLWVLAIFSTPSSLLVSEISHLVGSLFGPDKGPGFYVNLVGFLIFGAVQYGCIGYLFGKLVQRARAREGRVV